MKYFSEDNPEVEDYWGKMFRKVFGTPEGKKVLLYLFEESGMFMMDVPCEKEILFSAGKRAFMLEVLEVMGLNPEDLTPTNRGELDVLQRGELDLFGE